MTRTGLLASLRWKSARMAALFACTMSFHGCLQLLERFVGLVVNWVNITRRYIAKSYT